MAALLVGLCGCFHGSAQPPLDVPNLQQLLRAGTVHAIVDLPDGSFIVGGNFSTVYEPNFDLSIDRNNLARFTAAGALDLQWSASTDFAVHALALDASGALYAGGEFSKVNGIARAGLVKLASSGDGTVDATWTPSASCVPPDPCVSAIVAQNDGIYVGGTFDAINGAVRSGLARLVGAAGTPDTTWKPTVSLEQFGPEVNSIAVTADAVYVGGFFSSIGGQTRDSIAKLARTGAGAADSAWNANSNGSVEVLRVVGDSLYVGGYFTSIGGASRNRLARLPLSGTGQADATWNPGAMFTSPTSPSIQAIVADGAGDVYVAGDFKGTIGGALRNHVAKLSGTGTGQAEPGWNVTLNGPVNALGLSLVGAPRVGGVFDSIGSTTALGLAVLNGASGSVSSTQFVQSPGFVRTLAVAADGSAFVGGRFARVNGVERLNLLKLTPTGQLDPDWSANAPADDSEGIDGGVAAIALGADGSVYVGGGFSSIKGVNRRYLAKVSPGGSGVVDATWNPAPDRGVRALAVDASGVYAGGSFSDIGGLARSRLAKIALASGAVDATWNPAPNANQETVPLSVESLVVDPTNGVLYVGGIFTEIGGQTRASAARVSTAGAGAADGWNPGLSCDQFCLVYALALGAADDAYVGGIKVDAGSDTPLLSKHSKATGAVAANWGPNPNGSIHALAVQGNSLLVGGSFTSIDGESIPRFAKVSTDRGWVDVGFREGSNGTVYDISAFAGTARVGGFFSEIGGRGRQSLAAFDIPALSGSPTEIAFSENNINDAAFDGRFLFLGAWLGDGTSQNQGRVLVFERTSPGTWVARSSIEAPTPTLEGRFGYSVSVADGLLAVGAPGVAPAGAVYVFKFDSGVGSYVLVDTLTRADLGGFNSFGAEVDVSKGWVVTGAQRYDVGGVFDSGTAFAFACGPLGCDDGQTLSPPVATASENFGRTVAVDGDTIVVGTLGSLTYPFDRVANTWVRGAEFSLGTGLRPLSSIDLLDGRLVAGSSTQNQVSILRRVGATWATEFNYADTDPDSLAGYSLAITPSLAVFGIPFLPTNGAGAEGSARVLNRSGSTWSTLATLKRNPPDVRTGSDQMGFSVAAFGNVVVVVKNSLRAYAYELRPETLFDDGYE